MMIFRENCEKFARKLRENRSPTTLKQKGNRTMKKEELRKQIEQSLKRCPDILTPIKVYRWTPFGKNKVYELLRTGELRSFRYQGGYVVSKDDLIDYLVKHAEDEPGRKIRRRDNNYFRRRRGSSVHIISMSERS